jgi:hypothetical protein
MYTAQCAEPERRLDSQRLSTSCALLLFLPHSLAKKATDPTQVSPVVLVITVDL